MAILNLATRSLRIGLIGGSGLYEIEGLTRRRWVQVRTPFGPPSDRLLTGRLAGREVVFLPRHGRGHRILPSELNHRANIYAMKRLGVAWIISVSAVGSLQARYQPRDIVLPNQFLDRTKRSAEHTFFGRGIVAHIAFAHPVCEELRLLLLQSCRAVGARVHDGGTYVNMEGPAFSTRSESMTNHNLGFDIIGMTNLGEAKCAREAEIAYATMAMVTDYDAWNADEEHVTVDAVIENLHRNAAQAQAIITHVLPKIPHDATCSCHSALAGAILTDRRRWPARTQAKLRLLLAKYRYTPPGRNRARAIGPGYGTARRRPESTALTSAACLGTAAITANRTSLVLTPGTFAAASAMTAADLGTTAAAAAATAGATVGTRAATAATQTAANAGFTRATLCPTAAATAARSPAGAAATKSAALAGSSAAASFARTPCAASTWAAVWATTIGVPKPAASPATRKEHAAFLLFIGAGTPRLTAPRA